MTVRRIDTHCHVIPPGYARWLADSPLFHDRLPKWNLEDTLDLFERANIDTGILSVTIPGTWLGPKANPDDSRHWAREVNEFCAELVRTGRGDSDSSRRCHCPTSTRRSPRRDIACANSTQTA